MGLSNDDVTEILRIIDESELDELRIETDGFSLHVVRNGESPIAAPEPSAPAVASDAHTIAAPMLGTFYRAPGPGRPPFVEVGTRVEVDTIVCIIEVMKMMNSIPAGVAGTIAEVHVENAAAVEYDQPLFRVEP